VARYGKTLRLALERAGITDYVRPFHDGRHCSITNAAAAGTAPAALMARAGHSDFKTTQSYIDLAGEVFQPEAELLEERLWGDSGTRNRYKLGAPSPERETVDGAAGAQNRPGAGDSTSRSGVDPVGSAETGTKSGTKVSSLREVWRPTRD